ncbi:MAG: flagellar basal body rod C-terminal domain-containing protein, partial [Pseudomonadota bacterium]
LTANNIANAQTPGYTRKVMPQENRIVDGQGQGVRPLDVQRLVDDFLTDEMRDQIGRLGRGDILSDTYNRIQDSILGAPGAANQGLDATTRRLAVALQEFGNASESTAARLSAVGAIDDTMAELDDVEAKISEFRADIDRQIDVTVEEINSKLNAVERINLEITRIQAPADLLDQRDLLIKEIAELIEIDVEFEATGVARIYASGGEEILGQKASLLTYGRASSATADTVFGPIKIFAPGEFDSQTSTPLVGAIGTDLVSGGVRRVLTPELLADGIADDQQLIVSPFSKGKLEGLLEARDKILPELNDQITELATRLSFELNAAHNSATAVPPPSSLLGTNTDLSGFASATRSGSAYLSVVDAAGATVATIEVDLTAASAADLATQLDSDLGALGTAAIDGTGRLTIDLADTSQGIAIAAGTGSIETDISSINQTMSFSHYFGLNDLVVEDTTARRYGIRSDISEDVKRLASAHLDIDTGSPLSGTLGGAGDNRGALDLAAVMTDETQFVSRGGLPDADFTIGGYAAEITGLLATRADQAKQAQLIDSAIVEDIEVRQSAMSGVNIDEELSKLLQYQQSYSTAARVMSITNELFDELLNIAR